MGVATATETGEKEEWLVGGAVSSLAKWMNTLNVGDTRRYLYTYWMGQWMAGGGAGGNKNKDNYDDDRGG